VVPYLAVVLPDQPDLSAVAGPTGFSYKSWIFSHVAFVLSPYSGASGWFRGSVLTYISYQ
jgi:hypothetical protein